jgi:hypothetical protein
LEETHPGSSVTERRRSERVFQPVSLLVRGMDVLGQPFGERAVSSELNLHGCAYPSRHHLPKNTWVTLEIPEAQSSVRARVARIERPSSVREHFQVALELERPGNIWGLESNPPSWERTGTPHDHPTSLARENLRVAEASESQTVPITLAALLEKMATPMTDVSPEFPLPQEQPAREPASEEAPEPAAEPQSPLIGEWSTSGGRLAINQALEQAERKIKEAEDFSCQRLAARQEELERGWKAQLERLLEQSRGILARFEETAEALRSETQGAQEVMGRLAQARLQMEAAEAARNRAPAETPKKEESAVEAATSAWRDRLHSEMALAQAQWKELLDSSLDGGAARLAEEVSARVREVLREAEGSLSERAERFRQPLEEISSEARAAVAGIKSSLEQEVDNARSSLTEIERLAVRLKEHSAQLEAASHDTLNELHRRLERILESQTEELNRRAEKLTAAVPERLAPTLDGLCHQLVDRVVREVDAQLVPRVSRIPELVRELTAREMQAEESLRLHRERLRQASENSQRDIASQIASLTEHLHDDFESARKEAVAKWNEELDAGGVRASHAAAETIGRSSEWFQQEARARLQVLVEQTVGSAASGLEDQTAEARQKFGVHLTEATAAQLAGIQQNIDVLAAELAGKAGSRIDEAAEAAAASFGEVLRRISSSEVTAFRDASVAVLDQRRLELTGLGEELRAQFEADSGLELDRLRAEVISQMEEASLHARETLSDELNSSLDRHRAERETHNAEWVSHLDRLGEESAGKYQERMQTAGDAWVTSCVRRLNEHGQNIIEALMRSSDQALRDSCSKVLEGLASTLRERSANTSGAGLREPGERD